MVSDRLALDYPDSPDDPEFYAVKREIALEQVLELCAVYEFTPELIARGLGSLAQENATFFADPRPRAQEA